MIISVVLCVWANEGKKGPDERFHFNVFLDFTQTQELIEKVSQPFNVSRPFFSRQFSCVSLNTRQHQWLPNKFYQLDRNENTIFFLLRQELLFTHTSTFSAINSVSHVCGMSKRITNNFSDKTLTVSVSIVLTLILPLVFAFAEVSENLPCPLPGDDGRVLLYMCCACRVAMMEGCEIDGTRRREK